MSQVNTSHQQRFSITGARVEDVGGRDGIYFDAALDGNERRFLITRDALEQLDDRAFVDREDVKAAFDRQQEKIRAKVINVLSSGVAGGRPTTLSAADFESA